jgi:hypothetical protein
MGTDVLPMNNPFEGLRPWQPDHVKNLLRALLAHQGAIDASDTGVGKTFCALAIAKVFGCVPLVLGPKAVRSSWEDAAGKMGTDVEFHNYEQARRDHVPHVCIPCGRSKSMQPRALKIAGPPPCPECGQLMVPQPVERMGIEIAHGSGSFWKWNVNPTLMIFDECHLCGGSTSITGKILRSARKRAGNAKVASYTLCLSATAADNPEQMKNLGQAVGLFTGAEYWGWLQKHGFAPDWSGNWKMTEDSIELDTAMRKIHAQIFPSRGARLRRRDIPGFPQTLIDTLIVESDADLTEAINAIKAGTLEGRMHGRHLLELALVDVLPNYIKNSLAMERNSVAVFLNFRDAVDRLLKKFPNAGVIDGRQVGEQGDIDRRRVITEFQANRMPVLVANNQAGGAGWSGHDPTGGWTRDGYVVPSENGRQMKQVVGRLWRDGGGFSRYFFMGLRDTPHEKFLRLNQEKIRRIDILNGDEADQIFQSI